MEVIHVYAQSIDDHPDITWRKREREEGEPRGEERGEGGGVSDQRHMGTVMYY